MISILLTLLTALPITASAATSGTCGNNLTWTLADNGTLTISGTGDMWNWGYNGAPWYSSRAYIVNVVVESGVTRIGGGAFYRCESLTSITIPEGVTSIGDIAFRYCISLTSITIPEGVTSIGNGAFCYCHSLTSITIPEGVTSIGDEAFYSCHNLTSITIPDSVTSIGYSAFCYCESLTSITIPEGVTSIGYGAFYYCESLTSITIPDSVTSIGNGAFDDCESLINITVDVNNPNFSSVNGVLFDKNKTRLIKYPAGKSDTTYTIPEGVTSIDKYAFQYCISLTSITIPEGVTSIGNGAFYDCHSLTDVYYSGSEYDWAKISIGGINSYLTNATIHYNNLPPIEYEYLPPVSISNGEFNFASGKGSAYFDYYDYYFKNNAYSYNHDLAKTSMRLALSAYGKIQKLKDDNGEVIEKIYDNAPQNVANFLGQLGFVGVDYNDEFTEPPERNSIGVIAGRKHVIYPDGNYTLIAVAIRGGGYENEWGGNFNVGSNDHHAGFELARKQVVEFIKTYIASQRIGGNIKLWITGYSRAAATTNLTAAYFDENPSAIGSMVTLTPENIYAYCFEAPAGVVNPDNETGLYNNIFSIVNQHDFVPMVAMRKWGYDRYGITKYLPSAQTNKNYYDLRNDMLDYFAQYHKSDYKVDDFTYYYTFASNKNLIKNGYGTQGVYLEKVIDKLAENIGNPSNYENEFQEMFEYIGENIVGLGKTEELANSLLDEMKSRSLLYLVEGTYLLNPNTWAIAGTAYLTTRSAVKDAFENIGISVSSDAVDTLVGLIIDLGFDNVYTLLQNTSGIAQGHYPELCMAWLDAIDEDDFSDKRLRTLYLNCPVDMEIYDSNDNLVAAVYDNTPQKIDGSAIVPFIDENGQKIVYLPQDEEYRIEVIATDDGEVTYSVQERDINTGSTKVINYNNMSVKKDDTLTGTAENLKATEIATYMLSSNSVEVSEAEVFEDAEPITVETNAIGNGVVSTGGEYYKGEFAEVVATPAENEEFSGWYNGETIISSEATYRFQVTEAITLTAKFTENTCEIIFLDDEDDVISTQRIVKGTTVEIPEAPEKSGYRFEGFYKDKEYTTAITEGDVYTENTTLYAKYSEPSSSDGFYYFPIDDTTAEIIGYEYNDYELWIPVSLDGYTITKIVDSSFKDAEFETVFIPDTITEIGANAFEGCDYLETVNYIGTEEQWNAITIGENNDALVNADKVFDYNEDTVYGGFGEVDFTGSAVEGTLWFDYAYKNCVAIIEILNYDGETEKTLEIAIPAGTKEKEFSIPFDADDDEHEIYVSFVNNTTEKIEVGEGDWDYFYAERERFTDGDYTYVLSDGKAIIVSYNGTNTEVEIPATLGEFSVVGIDDYAFEECLYENEVEITSLTLPSSIESISEWALDCLYTLATISVADENEHFCVVDNVLFDKDKTRLVKYPAGKIGDSYSIPNTVKVISATALADNENLTTVIIPDSVTDINGYAFTGSAISTVTIPASVINIETAAFSWCYNLSEINVSGNNTHYTAVDGVLYNKDKTMLMQYPMGKENTSVVVSAGVTTICETAFLGCQAGTVVLPKSLTFIDYRAFYNCENLKTVLYYGSQEDWQNVDVEYRNDDLMYADFIYNYDENASVNADIISCYYDEGKVVANIKYNYIFEDCTTFFAIYNEDGRLVAMDSKPVTKNDTDATFRIEVGEDCKDMEVKAFFWESSNTLKPLGNVAYGVVGDLVLESTHPYGNNIDETKVYTYSGDCTSIDVTFSDDTETESGWDYIIIYDSNDNIIGEYSGTELAGQTIRVLGNTVKIRLTSDGSYTEYGYRTESIRVNK